MRWGTKRLGSEDVGRERIVKKFLLLPRQFYITNETRWLEFAYIKEKVVYIDGFPYNTSSYKWKAYDFATEDEYILKYPLLKKN